MKSKLTILLRHTLFGADKPREHKVEDFEQALAQYLDAKRVFTFWNGRVALYAILRGLKISEGDEVMMPGYTCVVVPNAVLYCGAQPTYVDIDPNTYNIDPALLEAKLTPRTKMLIVQHTYGIPAQMDVLMDWANRHGLPVIEDCCPAFGSRFKGQLCGAFGVASFFSGQWSKPFSTGLGGMAAVNEPDLACEVEQYCQKNLIRPTWKEAEVLWLQLVVHHLFVYPWSFAFAMWLYRRLARGGLMIGSSSKREVMGHRPTDYFKGISATQAAVGLYELGQIDKNIEHRKRLAKFYQQTLTEGGWSVPQVPEEADPVYVRFPVRVSNKAYLLTEAAKGFVELGDWFESPLHGAEAPLETFAYRVGSCPQAERASRQVVNLSTHLRVTEDAACRTVRLVLLKGDKVRTRVAEDRSST